MAAAISGLLDTLSSDRAARQRAALVARRQRMQPGLSEPRTRVMWELAHLCVSPHASIREAIARIDRGAEGIALAVDFDKRLLGTVTDGDVRRAILAGVSLDCTVQELLDSRPPPPHPSPVTAPVGTPDADVLLLMNQYQLRHIPLLDAGGRLSGIALLKELVRLPSLSVGAVVMAGGFGSRLRPLTDNMPKPMLPVGDKPLLQHIVEQLRDSGITRVNLTTHYMAEVISRHFGDGRDFGVDIRYVEEDRPLGTAGALRLLDNATSDEPMLVINGDILTQVDFRAMVDFHRDHDADLTVAVRPYDVQIPYGVVECSGPNVQHLAEKPKLHFFVNAGMYLLSPSVHAYIPDGERFDMTDLIQRLLDEGRKVVSFPVWEYWLDIGRHADYEQAQADVLSRRVTV